MNTQFINPLHLYRALLRETTYLFDHHVRAWTQEHIRSSFRDKAHKVQNGRKSKIVPYEPARVPSVDERHQLKRGQKFLTILQRANRGYQRQLRTVLQLTYGRKGQRKRALTGPLMRTALVQARDTPSDNQGGSGLQQAIKAPPARFSKEWTAPEDFMSLLNVQIQLSSYLSIRRQIRLRPHFDEKNRWGRPMPTCRTRNVRKQWYAHMAACIMPPVPETEWARLKAIAQRKEEFKLIPRRPAATRTRESEKLNEAESVANTLVLGIRQVQSRKAFDSIKRPHGMTPRFLSRFYSRHILNHAPVVVPNPTGKGLVSKWDNGKRGVLLPTRPKDRSQIEVLFG